MSRTIIALTAGVLVAASGAARAQEMTIALGPMTWQGNVAQLPVEVVNGTGAPQRPMELLCEFIALGRALGSNRQPVPALGPGARTTLNVSADVGGQLIDSVRCRVP